MRMQNLEGDFYPRTSSFIEIPVLYELLLTVWEFWFGATTGMNSYTAGCIRVTKGTLHTRMKLEELWDFTWYSVKTPQLASNIEIVYEKWRWYFPLGHWIFWSETYQIIEDVEDTRRIKHQYPKSKVSQRKIKYYYYTNNARILRGEHRDLSHKVLSMVEKWFH